MKNKNKAKISYEPEADILMWEITDKPIDFAKEIDNIVVHFTKNNIPVLIEILEASRFLARVKNLIKKEDLTSIKKQALVTYTIKTAKEPVKNIGLNHIRAVK